MQKEHTDGVILIRPYRIPDIEALFLAARESVNEAYPWLEWCHPEYSREDSEYWIRSRVHAWEKGVEYSFAIEDCGTQEFLGGCGINRIDSLHLFANLGYWVRSARSGHGVATAATILAARFGLSELKLYRLEILTAVGNIPSQKVAEKAGATKEGILRNRLLLHGIPHDALLYSLIPGDL